jgi:hypothetical protein
MKHLFILTAALFVFSNIFSQEVIETSKYTSCNDCVKEVCVDWEIIEKENPEKMMQQYHQLYLKVHLNTNALLLGEFNLRYRVSNDIAGNYSSEKTISIPLYSLEQFMEAHAKEFYLGESFKGYTKDLKTQLVCDPDPNETKIQEKNKYLSEGTGWEDASETIDAPEGFRKVEDKNSGCFYFTTTEEITHITWDGECNGKLINGYGILHAFNNEKLYFNYDGNINQGVLNGKGTIIWSNGNTYTGEYVDGLRNGQGTYTWANGDTYTGEWVDDLKNGQGTFTWTNGDTYTGEYVDALRNGQGTFTWTNGDTYTGGYIDDKRNGQGTYSFASGDTYTGGYIDDKKNGQGTFTFANGDTYTGGYIDDKRNGQGTINWANGDTYTGGHIDDKRNGQGVEICSKCIYGYKYGKKEGEFRDNLFYHGTVKNEYGRVIATFKYGYQQ